MINQSTQTAFPPKRRYEPLPRRGILAAAGFDLKVARRAAPEPMPDRPPLIGGLVRLAADSKSNAFLAGPVLGAPLAVMALEELIRRGAEEVIFIGLAGGLVQASEKQTEPAWAVGDLFLPLRGLSTEGTSAHYPAPLLPDADLCSRIRRGEGSGVIEEAIWSTDAIYRETAELTAEQWSRGARAVDMECTALWAAATFRGIRLASLLVISDILKLSPEPELAMEHQTGFHQPAFKRGLNRAALAAWQALLNNLEDKL